MDKKSGVFDRLDLIPTRKDNVSKKESRVWLTDKQKETVILYGFENIYKWFFEEILPKIEKKINKNEEVHPSI